MTLHIPLKAWTRLPPSSWPGARRAAHGILAGAPVGQGQEEGLDLDLDRLGQQAAGACPQHIGQGIVKIMG
jgi:hypothetical protein